MNRSRHSGHHDRSPAEVAEAVRRTSDAHPVPLGVDDPLRVDTAAPVDIDAVAGSVLTLLGRVPTARSPEAERGAAAGSG